MEIIERRQNLFGDMGNVERYDFSKANRSQEARVMAVTTVASVCFAGKSIGSEKLYDKLYRESIGLPSSSFEFVPVLLRREDVMKIYELYETETNGYIPKIIRFGRIVKDVYVITNLRALMYDAKHIIESKGVDIEIENNFFNDDPDEVKIIKENNLVFKSEIDIVTARQFIRHRISWQELSRRYVSGNKVPFSIYLTDNMYDDNVFISRAGFNFNAKEVVDMCIDMYDAAISNGVKPQDARRIIPQGAMTTLWSSWLPDQFESFVELRTANKAQWEIRRLSEAMRDMATTLN